MAGVIPVRGFICIMIFTACAISYMLRVNMSINIVAMVANSRRNNSSSTPECLIQNELDDDNVSDISSFRQTSDPPDYGQRYDWDMKTQGFILGAYFWGFLLTSIPGGLMAEKCGPRRVILWTTLIAGFFTILGPLAANIHYSAVIISRFIIGLTGGVLYPSLHCLISHWAPPAEKGKFVGALLGGSLGTVITWPALGGIIELWNWPWAFFIPGGLAILWCILWNFIVADFPDNHPRISDEEKDDINKALGENVQKKLGVPPYKSIFLSFPFWVLVVAHFGNLWGLFFLMTVGPNFMSTVLGFNLGHSGILSAAPYLARMLFGFIFGFIGDFIKKKNLLSATAIRKIFTLFSHIIPGLLLIVITTIGCNVVWTVAVITLSLGINGATTLTNLQNAQDLAPNYAGTLYGIANCIGSTAGFISPAVTGYFTSENNSITEWNKVFYLGATVYIICGLVFMAFGTADTQPWNTKQAEKPSKLGLENAAFEPDLVPKSVENAKDNTKV